MSFRAFRDHVGQVLDWGEKAPVEEMEIAEGSARMNFP